MTGEVAERLGPQELGVETGRVDGPSGGQSGWRGGRRVPPVEEGEPQAPGPGEEEPGQSET